MRFRGLKVVHQFDIRPSPQLERFLGAISCTFDVIINLFSVEC